MMFQYQNLLKLSGQRQLEWERDENVTLQRESFLFIIHEVVTADY